ncbi:hypothetical protein [Aneurinibacillus migulanus]|uniref:hypothetical protein n=1 Tax=Aneurinibacillus migulanus TaxID=47500 RepID=UPI00209EAF04|nr:hypothetical protein [Aneurinibacillus migulanus]MCP1358643.1 hypothetical protein [Aneurinibacillus migulanus]
MEVGDSEKEEVGCALRFSRRKANVSFSNLSSQEFVDVSNQMYIVGRVEDSLYALFLQTYTHYQVNKKDERAKTICSSESSKMLNHPIVLIMTKA